jgi:hypothetical protein
VQRASSSGFILLLSSSSSILPSSSFLAAGKTRVGERKLKKRICDPNEPLNPRNVSLLARRGEDRTRRVAAAEDVVSDGD